MTYVILTAAALFQTAARLDLEQLWKALSDRKWIFAGALVVGALVAAVKRGWLGPQLARLPDWTRPWTALIVGGLSVASAQVAAGGEWQKALFDGFGAAFVAVFLQDALVNGALKGKEVMPSAPWSKPATVEELLERRGKLLAEEADVRRQLAERGTAAPGPPPGPTHD